MRRSRSALVRFSLFLLFALTALIASGCADVGASGTSPEPLYAPSVGQISLPAPESSPAGVQVLISAAQETMSWDDRDPGRQKVQLPLLYLHRQRDAAGEAERTLRIDVTGVPAGAELLIEATSYHVDRSTDQRHTVTGRFTTPDRPCTPEYPCTARLVLDPGRDLGDFYVLQVKGASGELLWENPQPGRPDFVVLDTWDTDFGEYIVRIYYGTLFPFAKGEYDFDNRLSPVAVTDFIAYVFVPMVQETWHTQMDEWGFGDPIHPQWDRDRVVEIIVTPPHLALFDGTGPYTVFVDAQRNPYPERRIWWPASSNNYWSFDLLPNGYKMMFTHEFFHLAQWNVLLSTGHPVNFWQNVFVEAQAAIAPSVQYPEIGIEERHVIRDVSDGRAGNRFLSQRLNSSYRDMEAEQMYRYDLALYWRFLYEAHDDMRVLRLALEEMARHPEAEIVTALQTAMDRALAQVDGPFVDYEASLTAFARANYALRLENGRCTSADLSACEGFYFDSKGVYVAPPLAADVTYVGAPQEIRGTIPASYGMDFIEVDLDPGVQGQPLTVTLRGEGDVARFSLQVWRLGPGGGRPRALTPAPAVVPQNGAGAQVYRIAQVDVTAYDRLALIVTRVDPHETADPVGGYRIMLD
jgi:hypothetical protein